MAEEAENSAVLSHKYEFLDFVFDEDGRFIFNDSESILVQLQIDGKLLQELLFDSSQCFKRVFSKCMCIVLIMFVACPFVSTDTATEAYVPKLMAVEMNILKDTHFDTALKAWKKCQRQPNPTDHMAAKEANACGKDGERPTGIFLIAYISSLKH
jgi:hypothetical protein